MPSTLPWRAATATLVALALAAAPATGHEERLVAGYEMEVGWREEPAFAGARNAVQLILRTAGGTPVAGAELTVQIRYGDRSSPPLALLPGTGTGPGGPGEYGAALIPTRPGDYTFRLRGQVGGAAIDESFTSSPTTFTPVEDDAAISFPVADPGRGEVAQRLERIDARLEDARSRAGDASGAATRATILAALGTALGAIGVGALVSARRRERAPATGPRRSSNA